MEAVELTDDRGWLDAPAAASVARLDAALGRPLSVDAAGLSRDFQGQLWQEWRDGVGVYSRHPDDSAHPLGLAIDTLDWFEHVDLLNEHGWFQTIFWSNGIIREHQHFEYDAARDEHAYGSNAGVS